MKAKGYVQWVTRKVFQEVSRADGAAELLTLARPPRPLVAPHLTLEHTGLIERSFLPREGSFLLHWLTFQVCLGFCVLKGFLVWEIDDYKIFSLPFSLYFKKLEGAGCVIQNVSALKIKNTLQRGTARNISAKTGQNYFQ